MPNILIVDDDSLMRNALHKTLVRAGYEVEDAAGGTAALQAYQRQAPDLVITDIVMANGEGLDTIRALRKLDPHVKIIAISGGGVGQPDDYLTLAAKFGAARVLAKPFSGPEVLAVVASVLAGSSDKDSWQAKAESAETPWAVTAESPFSENFDLLIVRQLLKPGAEPVFGSPKTGRSRAVSLAAETIELLRVHKREQARLKLAKRTVYTDHRTDEWS